jgi:hypothetical protein
MNLTTAKKINDHDALVDALLGEDPTAARIEASEHITGSLELVCRLRANAAVAPPGSMDPQQVAVRESKKTTR